MSNGTPKKAARKASPPPREWTPPCDAALNGINWGAEFDGGRADPGRARALGAFIEALLLVDETNDAEVLTMLDRHLLGGDVNVVDDAMRKTIRKTRRQIAELHLALGHEASESQVKTKRVKLHDLLERLQSGDTLEPQYPDGFPESLKPGPMYFNDVEEPPLTELDQIMAELMQLDLRLDCTAEQRNVVESVVVSIRATQPVTLPLAAAKISYALNMFNDGSKKNERVVRTLYDLALKER